MRCLEAIPGLTRLVSGDFGGFIKVWDVGEVIQRWKRKLRADDNERSVDGRRVYHYAGFWEDPKEKVKKKHMVNVSPYVLCC